MAFKLKTEFDCLWASKGPATFSMASFCLCSQECLHLSSKQKKELQPVVFSYRRRVSSEKSSDSIYFLISLQSLIKCSNFLVLTRSISSVCFKQILAVAKLRLPFFWLLADADANNLWSSSFWIASFKTYSYYGTSF